MLGGAQAFPPEEEEQPFEDFNIQTRLRTRARFTGVFSWIIIVINLHLAVTH